MTKHLFFDDQRLFDRQGLKRQYGTPEPLAIYQDPNLAINYSWSWVVRGPDNRFHMLYLGAMKDQDHYICAAAISDDGIHFVPRNTAAESGIKNPVLPNQLFDSSFHGEIAAVLDDPSAPPETRYKILLTCNGNYFQTLKINDIVYTSPDLIHFTELKDSCWNPVGTEPVTGAFYNPVRQCYSILPRPDHGQRRVGYTETKDWHHFKEIELCMQADSTDLPLAELYGMNAIYYDGWFIGFPLIYSHMKASLTTKFYTGKMQAEMAYSLNGRYWMRALRQTFLGENCPPQNFISKNTMTWPTSLIRINDDELLLYAAVSAYEHGTPTNTLNPANTGVIVYKLRTDGFIGLFTDSNGHMGSIATRETVWHSGVPEINLSASSATCAIYPTDGALDGELYPIPGFSHEDCIPFTGDSCHWKPQWKGTPDFEAATKGKVVVLEIRLSGGAIWSISGDYTPLMNTEADRYRQLGILSERRGF